MDRNIIYLSRKDVVSVSLSMNEIIEALEKMFHDKGMGKVEMPPKPGIHTKPDAFIHAMPAYIPSLGAAGMKWISGYPDNQKNGLPYISGLLILNDPENGIPIAVMDATWITAQRTGAATALSAKYLARPESDTLGIIACGVQGKSNLEALACLYDFKKVKAYDIDYQRAKKFASEMGKEFGIEIEPVRQVADAVKKMDIVVTSGPILKEPRPEIKAGWLEEGAFASLVDFDSFWTGNAMQEVDNIATDDHAQMEYYRRIGYFKETPMPYADLGELVCGKYQGRTSEQQQIMAINLGIALDDMATAILIYDRANKMGVGTLVQL